jgi:hypothetical protein
MGQVIICQFAMFQHRVDMPKTDLWTITHFVCHRAPGPFLISTAVRTDATAPAVTEVFKEIGRLREKPATPEELKIARESLTRSLTSRFDTVMSSAASIADFSFMA